MVCDMKLLYLTGLSIIEREIIVKCKYKKKIDLKKLVSKNMLYCKILLIMLKKSWKSGQILAEKNFCWIYTAVTFVITLVQLFVILRWLGVTFVITTGGWVHNSAKTLTTVNFASGLWAAWELKKGCMQPLSRRLGTADFSALLGWFNCNHSINNSLYLLLFLAYPLFHSVALVTSQRYCLLLP